MIKAVFFDIDGTLLSFNTHRVPQSTVRALELLREKGIKVFIATGRSFHQIVSLDGLVFDGYITLNGSYCETADGKIIYRSRIPREDIEALIEHQKERPFPCTFSTADGVYINFTNELVEKMQGLVEMPPLPVRHLNEALDCGVYQMSAFVDRDEQYALVENVMTGCDATSWHPVFTDIIAKGNSKQHGIDRVLEYYGLNLENAISFGDGGNDISMLRHTPISVAMGNASDEVKSHATHVTDSVDDNGVWNALCKLGVIG